MIPRSNALIKFLHPFVSLQRSLFLNKYPHQTFHLLSIDGATTTYSTLCQAQIEDVLGEAIEQPKNSEELLRRWGCNDNDLSKLFSRRPSLRNADIQSLQSKLCLLQGLGITSSDLVKIVHCRPRFLSCGINHCFDERLEFFMTLFGSSELLAKAITRNPSLLTYDFHNKIKPVIMLYDGLGVCKEDLITMLLARPTMISRTSFCDEKMEYIRKSGVSEGSKMYKYVVTLIGISRIETIHEKVANFEKFGFSEDEILRCFGRSPLLMTLSVEKVQRNMTFVLGTLKLPPNVILNNPILFANLEVRLKPRVLLAGKIQEMGLSPQIKGPLLLRALRMREDRFLAKFISCHPSDVAEELMEFYSNVRGVKRLAEASKKNVCKGFPF